MKQPEESAASCNVMPKGYEIRSAGVQGGRGEKLLQLQNPLSFHKVFAFSGSKNKTL